MGPLQFTFQSTGIRFPAAPFKHKNKLQFQEHKIIPLYTDN
jgi:hypothetical protein